MLFVVERSVPVSPRVGAQLGLFSQPQSGATRVSEKHPRRTGCERERKERNRPDSFVRRDGFIARVVRGSIAVKFIHRVIPFIFFQRVHSAERVIRESALTFYNNSIVLSSSLLLDY